MEPAIPSDNLALVEPILVVSSDEEAHTVPEVQREKVEHYFVGNERADSNFEVEMPPKLIKFNNPNEVLLLLLLFQRC